MAFQVLSDEGEEIDARFDIEGNEIIFHARGGNKENGIDAKYGPGLRTLLKRIYENGYTLSDAWVDSTRVKALDKTEKRILELPAPNSADEVFTMISRNMTGIGRIPSANAQGGNSTKRIRLQIQSLSENELIALTKSKKINVDFNRLERIPADRLANVTPKHIFNAVIDN